jgi:TolB-like protein
MSAAQPPLALPDKPSLAVLPFTNMSGDPEQEFVSDGIAEDVISALSHYPSLFIIARNSTFTYKGRAVDVKQVGRELGVRYVLEGGVRKAGNRIRVTAQLIEAETGNHVWARHFDFFSLTRARARVRLKKLTTNAFSFQQRRESCHRCRARRPKRQNRPA